MRKSIIGERPQNIYKPDGWMNLEDLATVEVTSETPEFPIEGAVTLNGQVGWRAAGSGVQIIRLLFDDPVSFNTFNFASMNLIGSEHRSLRFDGRLRTKV